VVPDAEEGRGMTTYALLALFWVGGVQQPQTVRDGLTLEECEHMAATFRRTARTAEYRCVRR